MKLYIIELTSGQTIVAKDYVKTLTDEYLITVMTKTYDFNYTVFKDDIVHISEVESNKLPENFKKAFNL